MTSNDDANLVRSLRRLMNPYTSSVGDVSNEFRINTVLPPPQSANCDSPVETAAGKLEVDAQLCLLFWQEAAVPQDSIFLIILSK